MGEGWRVREGVGVGESVRECGSVSNEGCMSTLILSK